MRIKDVIIAFLFGALFATFSYLSFTFYKTIVLVNENNIKLNQVINFINEVTSKTASSTPQK